MNNTDRYLAATEDELRAAPTSRRLVGYANQRTLFPHAGGIRVEPEALILEGWRQIPRIDVDDVSLTFTDAYPRRQAAGIRGNTASFGLFGDLGKPLILSLRGGEVVYLLIDFRWWTGTNRARHWAPGLRTWMTAGAPVR